MKRTNSTTTTKENASAATAADSEQRSEKRSRTLRLSAVFRAITVEAEQKASAYTYCFGRNSEYRLLVADTRELRERAYALVYETYADSGYNVKAHEKHRLWFNLHHLLPDTITLLVECDGRPAATITVVPDSPFGLPADAVFPEHLAALRRQGRRPCEIASLAVATSSLRCGREILLHLFKAAYLCVSKVLNGTDMIGCVMAHHAEFYRRVLLFDELGDEVRVSPKTGVAVRWSRLDMETSRRRYRRHYTSRPGRKLDLYRFFTADEEQAAAWLNKLRRPLPETDLSYFLREKSDRWMQTDAATRTLLQTLDRAAKLTV